jgi:antibiotic biosynthesis monooxygenase (ABM) superfamily enzyme
VLEAILVGLIVLVAVLYAAWTLLPAAARLRLAQRLGAWGRRPGRAAWLQRASTAVEDTARRRAGACSDCGAVQSGPTAPSSRKPPRA